MEKNTGEINMVEKDIKVIKTKLGNSIQPSVAETERFICYLNKRFDLGLPDNLIVNIEDTSKNTKGFFRCKEHQKHYENTKQPLNYICISSIHLQNNPYETIAHETAHFYNYSKGIKDCSSNQYHNKNFKVIAEKLLLKVEKGKRGFAYTDVTEEFTKMLKDFKADAKAFHIFQRTKEGKAKSPNRNLLFMCGCGIKVRTARNQNKPFNAICQYCNTEFTQQ